MILRALRARARRKSPTVVSFAGSTPKDESPQQFPTSPETILEVHELASRFHTHPETVKRKLRQGKLHGFKFGRSWFVREADVQTYILDALESERHLRRRKDRYES